MAKYSPWRYATNARYIDTVLDDLRARPEVWSKMLPSYKNNHRKDAWNAAKVVLFNAVDGSFQEEIWQIMQDAVWVIVEAAPFPVPLKMLQTAHGVSKEALVSAMRAAARSAVSDPLLALIAWDSSAELLNLPPDVLRTMADLAPEPVNHQAALLLPYAIVKTTDIEETEQ